MTKSEAVAAPDAGESCSALWFEGDGRCVLRAEMLPVSGMDQVKVRTLFSGISRGTESLVFDGLVPSSEHERMRAPHQQGNFPFPVKYGYAAVGKVEAGPEELIGKSVFCLHPHQDRFCVPAADIHLLPETVAPERAVLAANVETALNIVWDAGIQPGDRVAVFGAGVVGLLVAYIASRVIGTEVVICDIDAERSETAASLGIRFALPDALPADCDILINASASAEALATAIDHAGFEARIVEASWYGEKRADIPLGGAFHARRLSIVSSQVGAVPPARRARWDFARRMAKALELLADPRLDCLTSGETLFTGIVEAYPTILASPATLCHRIRY